MTRNNVKRKKLEDELKVAEIMIKRDWVHKKTHSIKKYISKFYFACIQNLWNINNYPQVKYKFELNHINSDRIIKLKFKVYNLTSHQ
jgi:hypothetical protein